MTHHLIHPYTLGPWRLTVDTTVPARVQLTRRVRESSTLWDPRTEWQGNLVLVDEEVAPGHHVYEREVRRWRRDYDCRLDVEVTPLSGDDSDLTVTLEPAEGGRREMLVRARDGQVTARSIRD